MPRRICWRMSGWKGRRLRLLGWGRALERVLELERVSGQESTRLLGGTPADDETGQLQCLEVVSGSGAGTGLFEWLARFWVHAQQRLQ